MVIWLDVEDLFHYAANNRRPSGIQRLSFEMYRALHELRGDGVRFCRHDPVGNTLRTVPFAAMQALFEGMLAPEPGRAAAPGREGPSAVRRALYRFGDRLPLPVREPLMQAVSFQLAALRQQVGAVRLGARALRAVPAVLRRPAAREAGFESLDIREHARPGDWFAVLGSPWFHSDYAGFIGGIARARGMRTALLVYDLIPLMRPEWCDRALVATFEAWFTAFIPGVDQVFSISDATARDVVAWSARSGVPVRQPVVTLPIGTGFGAPADADATLPAGLVPGGYILFVSTIEARKNHMLAFRVWRRMVEELPWEQVPVLVFAGRVGWLVADLMQQLENCAYLDGKIVLVSDAGDAELAALYRGCRATLFPSLYEGWGLPVSESLSFGKTCLASNRTSVPEAGGAFCLYFDPENVGEAFEVIRGACLDGGVIAGLEGRIRGEFQVATWRGTVEGFLAGLR